MNSFDFLEEDLEKTPEGLAVAMGLKPIMFGGFTPTFKPEIKNPAVILPIVDKILQNLPANLQKNFPDNVAKKINNEIKTRGKFEVRSELLVDMNLIWRAPETRTLEISEFDHHKIYDLLRDAIHFSAHSAELHFIKKFNLEKDEMSRVREVLAIMLTVDNPYGYLVLCGEEYLALKNAYRKMEWFKPYRRIYHIIVKTTILPKNGGGDAVWEIQIYLPSMQIEKFCTVGGPEGLWETMKRKTVDGPFTFEAAVKKLLSK